MSTEALEAFVGQMTVAEFCSRTGRRIDELLGFCGESGAGASPAKARRGGSGRTEELDERVMALIEGASDGLGGRDLANATGASMPRVRAALKRLVDAKRLRFAGFTSARRYWAT